MSQFQERNSGCIGTFVILRVSSSESIKHLGLLCWQSCFRQLVGCKTTLSQTFHHKCAIKNALGRLIFFSVARRYRPRRTLNVFNRMVGLCCIGPPTTHHLCLQNPILIAFHLTNSWLYTTHSKLIANRSRPVRPCSAHLSARYHGNSASKVKELAAGAPPRPRSSRLHASS